MRDSRTWWIGFGAFSAAVLGGLALAGAVDRELPGVLVDDGGLVSNLTDGAWIGACGLAAVTAVREARAGRPWGGWLLVAALAGFAAWEEAEWTIGGREAVDLHNSVSLGLARRFGRNLTWAVAVGAAGVVAGALWLWRRPGVRSGPIAPHLAVAAGFLAVSAVMDVAHESGAPYVMGQWPLEEASELLAAVAVLGAPLRALAGRRGDGIAGPPG